MNKGDYVSIDVAEELKKYRYNTPCRRFYCSMHNSIADCVQDGLRFNYVTYKDLEAGDTLIPTLYEAQKWLREEHNINIEITTDVQYKDLWIYVIYDFRCCSTLDTNGGFNSYEEALNEGINNALTYIQNNENK